MKGYLGKMQFFTSQIRNSNCRILGDLSAAQLTTVTKQAKSVLQSLCQSGLISFTTCYASALRGNPLIHFSLGWGMTRQGNPFIMPSFAFPFLLYIIFFYVHETFQRFEEQERNMMHQGNPFIMSNFEFSFSFI